MASRPQSSNRPRVLVLAEPYLYATALADCLGHDGAFEVFAPDLASGQTAQRLAYDALITAGVVSDIPVDVVIDLPDGSFAEPVVITVDGITVPVYLDQRRPLDALVRLLHRYIRRTAPTAVRASTVRPATR